MSDDNTTVPAEETLRALRMTLVKILEAAPAIPTRVRLSLNGAKLDISWHDLARPAIPTIPADRPVTDAHVVRAPLVGTFYRAPEPGATPFVEVGDVVTSGQQLGIIEAMKLMNTIEADCDGRVVELPVADGSPVEFDQPLALIDPTSSG